MKAAKKSLLGIAMILMSLSVVGVTAYVYESAQQTVGQTVVNVATITLKNSALGNLEEGETKTYTKADVASLGAAISITTSKENVKLWLDSDIDNLGTYYTTYTLTVKYITVPVGSEYHVGDVAAIITIAAPDASHIPLDLTGLWAFDFELTTTAKSVSSDRVTTATIVVTAQST